MINIPKIFHQKFFSLLGLMTVSFPSNKLINIGLSSDLSYLDTNFSEYLPLYIKSNIS